MRRFFRVERQRARRRRCRGKDADSRAGVPALADMLRTHAQADARSDFIAGERRRDEILAGKLRTRFRRRDQRRQRHGADMQDALAVHVVEFEALHLGAIDQSRMVR